MTESLIGPLSYPALNTVLWNHGSYLSVAKMGRMILVADVVNGAGESRYSALRVPGAAGGYQVTAGMTLYATRLRQLATSAPALSLLISATADPGNSVIAAPAGVLSHNSRADGVPGAIGALASNVIYENNLYASFAAGLYPGIRCMTASSTLYVVMVCHEE